MDMLRHDHVTNHLEFVFLPDFFKDFQEQVSARCGAEKWFSLVATTGDVVKVATSIEPAQSFGHGGNFTLGPWVRGRGLVIPPFAATISRVRRTDWRAAKDGAPTVSVRISFCMAPGQCTDSRSGESG